MPEKNGAVSIVSLTIHVGIIIFNMATAVFTTPKCQFIFTLCIFFITVVAYKFTNLIVAKTSLGLLILFIRQC